MGGNMNEMYEYKLNHNPSGYILASSSSTCPKGCT
jgi:hypothetical protein